MIKALRPTLIGVTVVLAITLVVVLVDTYLTSPPSTINRDPFPADLTEPEGVSYREARQAVREWVESQAPTFVYDGVVVESIRGQVIDQRLCRSCYSFDVEFLTRTPGYGSNRDSEQNQVRVVTSHLMQINIGQGRVTAAVTDGVFDELSDERLR